jgi:hypothetical protein
MLELFSVWFDSIEEEVAQPGDWRGLTPTCVMVVRFLPPYAPHDSPHETFIFICNRTSTEAGTYVWAPRRCWRMR